MQTSWLLNAGNRISETLSPFRFQLCARTNAGGAHAYETHPEEGPLHGRLFDDEVHRCSRFQVDFSPTMRLGGAGSTRHGRQLLAIQGTWLAAQRVSDIMKPDHDRR